MVAYSFQSRFAEPILAGTKGGTIRAPRRAANRGMHSVARQAETGGHARVGEELQLYITRQCKLIARKICVAVEPIVISFATRSICLLDHARSIDFDDLERFARFDGFDSFDEMAEFWKPELAFNGWHIRWSPLPAGIS
jgi:hypothetical protein